MKKTIITGLLLAAAATVKAQSYIGYLSDNYRDRKSVV